MRYRELTRRLRDLGCIEGRRGKGSHVFWHNPATGQSTAVPNWGSKDLALGTVRAIVRGLGLTREEFGPIK
ncbi:MAG: type II toxin-antitoxin system HicA family toxin [Anaerolineae bacterium]|nr:type II toxin-antitoxin system HicA family toxin [Anaerolineae bacterium]